MRKLALFLLLTTAALAAKKEEPIYQEAVVKSFRTVPDPQICIAGNCLSQNHVEYTVLIEQRLVTIQPTTSKNWPLADCAPGDHFSISLNKGSYFVKVGNKTSPFKLLAAE